ncbi:hypothetical protein [Brevibacterium yomogidense]|uniref:hypothetical protein n=1 Tax=Brevibacterium yomogidense TaxID=946573 RepID=UPI0018E043FD|nr:hypothetical protein [Brevibacterium yomogidense]
MRLDHHDSTAERTATGAPRFTARAPRAVASRAPRTIAALVGVAGALTLSACGQLEGLTTDEPCGSPAAGCVQITPTDETTDGPGMEGTMGSGTGADGSEGEEPGGDASGDGPGTDSDGGSGEGQTTVGPKDGEIRTESLAGDDSIEVDEDGNGVVPAAALEADIEDLFVNKYGIDVTEVECRDDMKVMAEHGSQNCDIHTEKRTYFGTIGIRGFEGDMVKYELYFPGLDEDALDL